MASGVTLSVGRAGNHPANPGGGQYVAETTADRRHRFGWVRLLKRVFNIDMQHYPNYGAGAFEIIAAILERPLNEKIAAHLALAHQPPTRAPARELGQHPA